MKSDLGFTLPKIFLVIVVVIILGGFGWFAYSISQSAVMMEIVDSGSTNFAGWDLKIHQNGSGNLTCYSGRYHCNSAKYKSGTFPATLKKDLAATNLKSYKDTCAPNTALNSVDTLIYHKVKTIGIDCYVQTENTPLAKDLKVIYDTIDA